MRSDYLFCETSIFDVLQHQTRAIKSAVQALTPNFLLNVSENDLIASLVDELRLDVPSIKEEEIHIAEHGETQIDVSRDPMRFITDRSRPFYIPGTKTVIAVPFDGDAGFFKIRPQSYSLNPPPATVADGELHLTFLRADHDAEAVKREYTSIVAQIKTHLGSLRESATTFNNGLEATIRQQVGERKSKLLADAGMANALGLPMKKRQDAPSTYSVPVQRRRPKIDRPKATMAPFVPELALPNPVDHEKHGQSDGTKP
jgi:hypothetical protein